MCGRFVRITPIPLIAEAFGAFAAVQFAKQATARGRML
jgi:hypothetical protein